MAVVDFKKLLPSSLRKTKWGDFIDAYQEQIYVDVKSKTLDNIRSKFIFDEMTEQELKDMAAFLGFNLAQADGFTTTVEYLKKEIITIVPRILNKTTNEGYKYVFYIFNLIGEVFPLLLANGGVLNPFLDWLTFPETEVSDITLDEGRILDELSTNILYYDALNKFDGGEIFDTGQIFDRKTPVLGTASTGSDWVLDDATLIGTLTRHFLISYFFQFIESETEFMSTNTARGFHSDIKQMKRIIEIPHYQARLLLTANSSNTEQITEYKSEDQSITAFQNSILIKLGLDVVTKIQFGNGSQNTIDTSITGVNNLISEYEIPVFDLKFQDATDMSFRNKLSVDNSWFDFKEVALLDSVGDCIFYAKFPWVRFSPEMLSNFYLFFEVV